MSVRSRSNWNLEVLVFEERGKPKHLEKNLSEQGREPTTNSTQIWRRRREFNPGHIGERQALSPLRHPLLPKYKIEKFIKTHCSKINNELMSLKIYKTNNFQIYYKKYYKFT